MAVKPAPSMDDETFSKHLGARHAGLADKLRRLAAMRGANETEIIKGGRALHATEHRMAHTIAAGRINWAEHEHSDG